VLEIPDVLEAPDGLGVLDVPGVAEAADAHDVLKACSVPAAVTSDGRNSTQSGGVKAAVAAMPSTTAQKTGTQGALRGSGVAPGPDSAPLNDTGMVKIRTKCDDSRGNS
jgi:hypothetical protein